MALDFTMPQINPQDLQIPAGAGPAIQQPGFLAQLLTKLQDPNVKAAIGQTGLNLMRSPAYGQNSWDVAANALQSGMGTLQQPRERDRARGLETQDRVTKEQQRTIDNNRADRQVGATEKNAATQEKATDANIANLATDNEAKKADQKRADTALNEAIRHNKSSEEIDLLRAEADKIRATAYSGNRDGRTPAEIVKLDRLKKYAQTKLGLDEIDADKYAFDYLQAAKGKSPGQQVRDEFKRLAMEWADQLQNLGKEPTPEIREQWKKEAIDLVKFAEEAGTGVTDKRGNITRPGTSGGTVSPSPAPQGAAPPTAASAVTPPIAGQKNPATERSIEAWKLKGGTPEQIKVLIATGGENPAAYGY